MKSLTPALAAHLAQEVTTLCTCWKATLQNGTAFGFTDHTSDLVIGGVLYESASGYTPTAIQGNSNLAVDNLEVVGLLDSATITDADLNAGLWDYADIEIFQVNYADLTMGSNRLVKGRTGEIKYGRQEFTAELRGLAQQLQQTIGEVYSASCRAQLGDARCKVDLAPYTFAATVTGVTDQRQFAAAALIQPAGYFAYGKVIFDSGANAGLSMEVKASPPGAIELQLPMPYPVAIGDAFRAIAGCRKRFQEDCKAKFSNVINFRGEPWVPGNDQMLKAGGQ